MVHCLRTYNSFVTASSDEALLMCQNDEYISNNYCNLVK